MSTSIIEQMFANYCAGYQAATSRQEAKIKQMLEALEAIAEYMPSTSAIGLSASSFNGNVHAADKVRAAIAAAKEAP